MWKNVALIRMARTVQPVQRKLDHETRSYKKKKLDLVATYKSMGHFALHYYFYIQINTFMITAGL